MLFFKLNPNSKFWYNLILVNIYKCCVSNFIKMHNKCEFDFSGVMGVVLGIPKVGSNSWNIYIEVIYHNKQWNHCTQSFLPQIFGGQLCVFDTFESSNSKLWGKCTRVRYCRTSKIFYLNNVTYFNYLPYIYVS